MIKKGQAFTFMYETRDKSTGDLVPDSANSHTIKVFYQNSGTWAGTTIISSQTPSGTASSITTRPIFIGSDTGLYLCQIPAAYTDCEHVIVSVTSSNTDVIVPMQQFYPVGDVTVDSTTASAVATEVWTGSNTRSLSTAPPTANDIRNAVWGATDGTRGLTTATLSSGSLATKANLDSLQSHGDSYWIGGGTGSGSESGSESGTSTSITVDTAALATQVGRLEGYVDTLATNVGYLSSNVQTISTAATTLFTGTNSLASAIDDIPHDVWTYTTYSDIANHQPVKAIADTVWGRSQNGTNRQLTSATLGAVGAGSLAKSTDVAAPVIDSEDIQLTVPTAIDVATAVWNYGKATNAEITDYRALSTPTIIAKNGTTSLDVATVSTGSSTVDTVVWGAQNKTLSSEVLDNTKSLAVSTDIPEAPDVSDLTTIVTLLTKVLGVLCHWKEDGSNIVVYNDENETILTIPTVKNKYGDILQMGTMPEE